MGQTGNIDRSADQAALQSYMRVHTVRVVEKYAGFRLWNTGFD